MFHLKATRSLRSLFFIVVRQCILSSPSQNNQRLPNPFLLSVQLRWKSTEPSSLFWNTVQHSLPPNRTSCVLGTEDVKSTRTDQALLYKQRCLAAVSSVAFGVHQIYSKPFLCFWILHWGHQTHSCNRSSRGRKLPSHPVSFGTLSNPYRLLSDHSIHQRHQNHQDRLCKHRWLIYQICTAQHSSWLPHSLSSAINKETILVVMNTTELVVEIRLEKKNSGPYE